MSGNFNRFLLAALLLCAICAQAVPIERTRRHLIDSLEVRLQEINNPDDSIVTLYNIFDLSSDDEARVSALNKLYLTAKEHGREIVQNDALKHLARVYQENDSVLGLIETELNSFGDSDRNKEAMLFVRMLRARNLMAGDTPDMEMARMNELSDRYILNSSDDEYLQTELLYALCIAMGKTTQTELLKYYLNQLQAKVEGMRLPMGTVRDLVYKSAAPIFTRNRLYSDAIAVDKKNLNILDSVTTSYAAHGRPYRNLYPNRYAVYRRMLANYRGLPEDDVEFFYAKVREAAANSPVVAESMKADEDCEIFYRMARKEYAKALPALKRQVDNPFHRQIRHLLLRELVGAAGAVGDSHTELMAALDLKDYYENKLNIRYEKGFRELQSIYDFNELKKEAARQEIEVKERNLRLNRWILGIVGGVCLMLVIMFVVMLRQYRRIKHLAAEHLRTTEILRTERNDLKLVQQELIKARDKAFESEKLKTEFTNMMSHEVKAPLAAVQEYSRLIVDCIPGEQKKYLERFAYIIEQNVRALNRLVSDVLDMSSFEFGTMTVSKSVESIDNICLVAIDSVFNNGKATSDDVKVVYNSRKQPDATVVTDMVRVTQVLMNLLNNADKFTEKGTISLEYEVDDANNQVRFIVSDTGIGIPDDCEEVIFERYRKLSPLSRGLGLGLYISRKIAILLKGDVRVDTSYHGGARFIFTIMKEDWAEGEN